MKQWWSFLIKISTPNKIAHEGHFGPKWAKSEPNPFQNGIKWNPKPDFSALFQQKWFCLFYLVNNHIPTVLDRSFFYYFPSKTGAVNRCPKKTFKQRILPFFCFCKLCEFWVPGGGGIISLFWLFFWCCTLWAPRVSPAGQPPGLPGVLFHRF